MGGLIMRYNKRSKDVGRVWYDKSIEKWSGSVLISYDENTEQQLRKSFTAKSKQELIVIMNQFKKAIPPVFMY